MAKAQAKQNISPMVMCEKGELFAMSCAVDFRRGYSGTDEIRGTDSRFHTSAEVSKVFEEYIWAEDNTSEWLCDAICG